jgi:hypothetical protein
MTAFIGRRGRLPPTIGFLGVSSAAAIAGWLPAFVQLRELGWIEGRTVAINYRWAEDRPSASPKIAAEFARGRRSTLFSACEATNRCDAF